MASHYAKTTGMYFMSKIFQRNLDLMSFYNIQQ
jgi:hypothetical protein